MTTTSQHNWLNMNIESIISGVSANGVRFLELFLQDYTKEFNKKVTPSCNKCVANYLKEYQQKFKTMENDCKYTLIKKREGIQLKFGSSVHVTNANITNEYAEALIERFTPIHKENTLDFLFSKYPKVIVEEVVLETNTPPDLDSDLKLSELRIKYPNIKAVSKEDFLAKI